MAKQSGLGDNLYVGGYDLSGDVGSLSSIHGGYGLLDVTSIDKSAYERLGGLRDGGITYSGFFNDSPGRMHKRLSILPTTDQIMTYCRGTTLGGEAACMVAKQVDYNPTRGQDGSLTLAIAALSNGFGLEWGNQLTAGKRTDTASTNGVGIDTLAATSFGGQAYLQLFAFTGTSVVIKIQDSADNATFADVTGFAFTSATGVTTERLQLGATATLRRYLRVVSLGTFTNAQFSVVVMDNVGTVAF